VAILTRVLHVKFTQVITFPGIQLALGNPISSCLQSDFLAESMGWNASALKYCCIFAQFAQSSGMGQKPALFASEYAAGIYAVNQSWRNVAIDALQSTGCRFDA